MFCWSFHSLVLCSGSHHRLARCQTVLHTQCHTKATRLLITVNVLATVCHYRQFLRVRRLTLLHSQFPCQPHANTRSKANQGPIMVFTGYAKA